MATLSFAMPQPLYPTSSPTFDAVFLTTPITSSNQAATKSYVDLVGSGLNPLGNCLVATTGNMNSVYNNGTGGIGATLTNDGPKTAIIIDGIGLIVGDRVLVKNQFDTTQNGIYSVTVVGSGVTNWVLTRATDYDQPSEMLKGSSVFIEKGSTSALTTWFQNSDTVVTVGISSISYLQYGGIQGNVIGPDSSVIHRIATYADTSGKRILESLASVDVSGNMYTPGDLLVGGNASITSNLVFIGSRNRITGNFSSNTIADRVSFQSNLTNGVTRVGAVPNGVGVGATYTAYVDSDPTDSAFIELSSALLFGINIGHKGSGTTPDFFPIRFDNVSTAFFKGSDKSFNLWAPTTGSGYLKIKASNNSPDKVLTITNDSFTDDATISVPYPGVSSAKFALRPSSFLNTAIPVFNTDGLLSSPNHLSYIEGSSGTIITDTFYAGQSGRQGLIRVYSGSASKGLINITATDNLGDYEINITNEPFSRNTNIIIPASEEDDVYLVLDKAVQTLSGKTLTAPKIVNGDYISDNNGNEQLIFSTTTSAVNEITVKNASTGNAPSLSATGSDTDIDFNIITKGTGKLLVNGAPVSSGSSGTYTPTLTLVSNLSSASIDICQYCRVENVVTVSGRVFIEPTLPATSTQLGISLPVASNFLYPYQCGGTAFSPSIAGQGAAILSDLSNDRAQLEFISSDITSQAMCFSFTYLVI